LFCVSCYLDIFHFFKRSQINKVSCKYQAKLNLVHAFACIYKIIILHYTQICKSFSIE
jgi:acetaldehyde dehydrogenase (acetylating)